MKNIANLETGRWDLTFWKVGLDILEPLLHFACRVW